jgi:pimeloyl-ACP methyl ester carboxylesterase
MATLFIDDVAVEVEGDGAPVLCIHGLGGSSNTWTPILPALAGRKVIRLDLPGSGRSKLPAQALTIEAYVLAVRQVLKALKIESVDILAHSMGTIVAQHFAVAYSDSVTSLVLFGPLVAPPEPARPAIRARAELARQGAEKVQEIADAIVAGATSKETKASNPMALTLVRESVMRQPPEGYAQSCEALASAQSAPIEEIAVPTLLVTGDQDGVAPAANVNAMAQRIRGSKVLVLEGCGHWTTFEKTDACIKAIKEALSNN